MPDDITNMVAEQIMRIKREHDRAYQSALRDNQSHQWSYVHGLSYALAVLGVAPMEYPKILDREPHKHEWIAQATSADDLFCACGTVKHPG